MHIESTTHEHGITAKVYTYEGDFDVADDAIRWHATVCHAEQQPRRISGEIPITSPAVPALAEKVVRDAIVQTIDTKAMADHSASQLDRRLPD